MRSKELKGVAQNLAAMVCSEARLRADLERLAELPDGEVTLDLIQGAAIHSESGAVSLSVVPSLALWLGNSGARNIGKARVSLRVDTSRPPTHRETLISFSFKGRAVIEAQGRTYVGEATNHVWHNRPAQRRASRRRPSLRGFAATAGPRLKRGVGRRNSKEGHMKGRNVVGAWVAIGVGIGAAMGAATDSMAIWVAVGVGAGVAIGALVSRRGKFSAP